jgi:hypothetical protein
VALDDFSAGAVGQFPAQWRVRKDAGAGVYRVAEEQGRRFLRAQSDGLGIQAARAASWDLEQYPVLAWAWRPQAFPPGADERSGANDSALAVYMLVEHSKIRGPKAVKYIWSERVPAGTRLASNAGLTQVRVARSGASTSAQEWVEERMNVREDFKAYFDESRTPRPAGIAVLTDADDTRSRAAGDYANFRVCRR